MMPSLFLSHGSPGRVLTHHPANEFLRGLSGYLEETPTAIVVVSAHWQSAHLTITDTGAHETLHDFGGFEHNLYQIQYRAEQPQWLTHCLEKRLVDSGLHWRREKRPLDHGVWTILQPAFPQPLIPVAALSLPEWPELSHFLELGRALAPLREQNVLIIGSGSATHNLMRLNSTDNRPTWANEFVHWLQGAVASKDLEALTALYERAPHAALAHPTREHYLPLLVAMGAAEPEKTELLHDSYELGSLNNSSWAFF